MTGYQKLKKENEILWANIRILLKTHYSEEKNKQEMIEREIAWIKAQIQYETK